MIFRVYDPDEDKYREGCTLNQDGIPISSWGKEKPNWIVQKYIGMKDKDGQKIYEGDIVSFDELEYGYESYRTNITGEVWFTP